MAGVPVRRAVLKGEVSRVSGVSNILTFTSPFTVSVIVRIAVRREGFGRQKDCYCDIGLLKAIVSISHF